MDVKFGKIKPNNNIFSGTLNTPSEENFFTPSESSSAILWEKKENAGSSSSGLRLNDYDSTILENNAYQSMPDEIFKMEHKMEVLENNLSKIINEIEALQSLGESIQISDLIERKTKIEEELAELNKKYSELGLSAKISGQIAAVVNKTHNRKNKVLSNFGTFVSKKFLTKISKTFNNAQLLKEALDTLSNINLSVDELVTMQIPYGETEKRYEKLTACLKQADVIHSQISKNVKAITKKRA